MSTCRDPLYRRHRFPPEVISYAVWLYFRFPLSLRVVEEMLAEPGICVTYETVRQWGEKFGQSVFRSDPQACACSRRQMAYG
jgi:putative transposase